MSVEIESADGTHRKLGPESPAHQRPTDLTFTTALMEGFGTCGLSLHRRTDVDWQDINLLDKLRVIASDGVVAYEGRVTSLPRTGLTEVAVSATGLVAELSDHRVTPLYVDRDLSQWQEPTLARRVAAGAEERSKITSTSDASGIRFEYPTDPLTTSYASELYYRAPDGETVGAIQYTGTSTIGAQAILAPFYVSDDNDAFSSGTSLGSTTLDGIMHTISVAVPEQYLMIRTRPSGSLTPTAGTYAALTPICVQGNRSVSLLATDTTVGVAASDVIRDLLAEAPSLQDRGGIQNTTYAIRQAAWHDPATPYEIIQTVNGYHLWNFAVWADGAAAYGPLDISDYTWQVRSSEPGVTVDLHGDELDGLYNGVDLTFTDAATGLDKRLTPDTSTDLRDAEISNPVVAHGNEKWLEVALSFQVPTDDALQIARAALAEANAPKAAGSITVQGWLRDRQGNRRPAWLPRAGETVAITDHQNPRPRLITETSWDDNAKTVTLTLETAPRGLDAWQARLASDIAIATT